MTSVQAIEEAVKQLPETDLMKFQQWFLQFSEDIWDKKIENDALLGKLDNLAAEALAEYHNGQATEL